jgi:superfamily II DNA or RNA helicase
MGLRVKLRDYQGDIIAQVNASTDDVLVQLDTGAGKTPIIAALASRAPTLVIAHRNVLIAQLSAHLARGGVRHHVIATRHTAHACQRAQAAIGLATHIDPRASTAVASLLTLSARARRSVLVKPHWRQIIIDEAHHVAPSNTWARVRQQLPGARLIGLTATPCRLDGASLGRTHGGLFDRLIQADSLGNDSTSRLIARGYLCGYCAFSIASIARGGLRLGATGDYTSDSIQRVLHGRALYGDALSEYRRIAPDSRALAICAAIGNAEELAETAREQGLSATVVHSGLGASENDRRLQAFREGRVRLLANVDMLGEGFDVPGIETLIMLRPTASFGRYRQWIGRALRPSEGKSHATLIDHVGNIVTHGLPDDPITWRIDQPPPQQKTNLIDCAICHRVFKAWLPTCPECGAKHDLRRRISLGSGYVNQAVIDVQLCEARQHREQSRQRWENEIVLPSTGGFGGDLIGRTCQRLFDWVVATLTATDAPRALINDYLRALTTREAMIARFTLADLKADRQQTILKEFQKWQSTSAAQTRRKAKAAQT